MTTREGWGFTTTSRKAHYFVDGTALCGKYGFRHPNAPLEQDNGPSHAEREEVEL